MKKLLSIFTLVVLRLLTISSTSQDEVLTEKVTICHVPPGNPDNASPITINALNAHLVHGDVIGDCSSPGEKQVRGSRRRIVYKRLFGEQLISVFKSFKL